MRRFVIFGALVGIGVLATRVRVPRLHERLMARCEGMFDRMPDSFPPKRMLRGLDEIRANTARILELLETGKNQGSESEGNESEVPGQLVGPPPQPVGAD